MSLNNRQYHGLSKHPLYRVWKDMKGRCYSKNNTSYLDYGKIGIAVCDEWINDFQNFYNWAINKWSKDLTIERVNVSGNYSPKNCKFISKSDQARNKRTTVYITAFGETKILEDWAVDKRCPVTHRCIIHRIKNGWDTEKAISTKNTRYRYIVAFGEEKTISDWVKDDRCKVGRALLTKRITNGIIPEEAMIK
jgi:hypothetical protein